MTPLWSQNGESHAIPGKLVSQFSRGEKGRYKNRKTEYNTRQNHTCTFPPYPWKKHQTDKRYFYVFSSLTLQPDRARVRCVIRRSHG